MSQRYKRRNQTKKKTKVKEPGIDPSVYFSNRRDAFYGGLLGAAVVSLIFATGNLAVLGLFSFGYFILFIFLFLGIKITKRPIRFSQWFWCGSIVSMTILGTIIAALKLSGA